MYIFSTPIPEPKKYSVTLSDGTKLKNLTLNGNNFVTDQEITKEMFNGNLKPVIISDGSEEIRHEYMDLVHFYYDKNEKLYYFVLADVSERENALREALANIDYLLMISDS